MQVQTVAEFREIIKDGVSLVDFYADWCGPCKALIPIINELEEKYKWVANIIKVDIEALPELAAEYGVMSIPTTILLNGRVMVAEKMVGVHPKDFYIEALDNELWIEQEF